jgi:L-fucose mutarotase
LSPDLLKILMEIGHCDGIVIADGNFPAASVAQRLIRLDGHKIPDVLKAILKFYFLYTCVEFPVGLLAVTPGENVKPAVWEEYRRIILKGKEHFKDFEFMERFNFYERAKSAYAVIATGESVLYANIILKEGIVV